MSPAWRCYRCDDAFSDLQIDRLGEAHSLLQPGFDGAVGCVGRLAVAPVDMQHDGAGESGALKLKVDAAPGPGLLARGQPPACSSSKRLIGPPGMMVEMACL